jgi:hypothetical protein
MHRDKLGPAEVVGGNFAKHIQNLFGGYTNGFHLPDVHVTIITAPGCDMGNEMEINRLNQFRMARVWEQERKDAQANKSDKLPGVHDITFIPLSFGFYPGVFHSRQACDRTNMGLSSLKRGLISGRKSRKCRQITGREVSSVYAQGI